MFRQLTVIVLMVSFAAQTLQRTFLVLDYYANNSAFVMNCENRLRPQLHCNGQCILMKKFREQEKKEQRNPEQKSDNKNEVISYWSDFASLTYFFPETATQNYHTIAAPALLERERSIFHPPGI